MCLRFNSQTVPIAAFGLFAVCCATAAATPTVAREALPTELRPVEINVTHDFSHRWGEPVIAINPKNPNNIIYHVNKSEYTYACQKAKVPACAPIKSKDILGQGRIELPRGQFTSSTWANNTVYVSFDRGQTWKTAEINRKVLGNPLLSKSFGSDPVARATQDGTFWITWEPAHIGRMPLTAPGNYACPVVSKSTDGGLTWSNPVCAGTPVDHEWLAIDDSTGTLYEASSGVLGSTADGRPNSPSGAIQDRWLVTSKDGVRWSTPRRFGGTDGTSNFSGGGLWMVASHGALATAYISKNASACAFFVGGGAPCVVFQTTSDGGVTWVRHRVPSADVASGVFNEVSISENPKKPSHYTVATLNSTAGQFLVYRTGDSGATWNGPAVVTEDATKKHFKPSMSSSPSGVVALMWRTQQPGGEYDIWAAISDDEGATFTEPLQISGANSPPNEPTLMGNFTDDLSDITLDDQEAFLGWGDWRPGDRQGYLGIVKLEAFRHK